MTTAGKARKGCVNFGEAAWLLEKLQNLHTPGSNQPRLTKASDPGMDKARHWSDLGSMKIHPRCTFCLYSCLQSPQNSRFAWSTETLLNSAIWIVATQKMAKPCNVLRNQELSTFFSISSILLIPVWALCVSCDPPVFFKPGENSEISSYGQTCKAISFSYTIIGSRGS